MNIVEKTEDEQYKEWLAKNEKFLKRYNEEHKPKQELENFGLYKFFEGLTHEQWLILNRPHIYVELQEILRNMLPYFLNESIRRR